MHDRRQRPTVYVRQMTAIIGAAMLVACSPGDPSGSGQDSASGPSASSVRGSPKGAAPVIPAMPDACEILTTERAGYWLAGRAVKRPQSQHAAFVSRCVYADEDPESESVLGLIILSLRPDAIAYGTGSEAEISERIATMLGGNASYAGRPEISGADAYAFGSADSVQIWVNTGISAPSSPVSGKTDNEYFISVLARGFEDTGRTHTVAGELAGTAHEALAAMAE